MCEYSDRRSSSMGHNLDEPPNSRLFIVGSSSLTENDFEHAFNSFGNIEEIWLVKDRQTGQNKGVAYIKFSKTSEAANALEAMNGKRIGNVNRAIKVLVAASRDQGSKRQANEEERTLRLFVLVPKSMTSTELQDIFKVYGDIDYAVVIRDKSTYESKGYGYVKYLKFSHAATAFENCDRKFKAVFAEPRKTTANVNNENIHSGDRYHMEAPSKFTNFNSPLNHHNNAFSSRANNESSSTFNGDNYRRLTAIVNPVLNEDQVWKLFDIVPGMDYCQLQIDDQSRPTRGIATIVYISHQWAVHAKEKLHGFEYPPGSRLIVKPYCDDDRNLQMSTGSTNNNNSSSNSTNDSTNVKQPDILHIAETLAQATSIIQAAGLSPDILHSKLNPLNRTIEESPICNVKLPEIQPLAPIDEPPEARCFIVCFPNALSQSLLKNVFCRFGHLIEVYMLTNRKCGFAKYGNRESAARAISVLHGAEVSGVRLKVMEAEDKPDYGRKRQRLDPSSTVTKDEDDSM